MAPHSATVTLWFLSTDTPQETLRAEPAADRGFGRKYLAQLNPAWPVTPIGTFPLNRSEPASEGEFYVGGYPGIVVVHTWLEELDKLSALPESLLHSAPASRILAVASNPERTYGGYAVWHEGKLHRSLCAVREWIIEDVGLPEPFEAPYWAGEVSDQLGGLALPFDPLDLVAGAQKEWLGVDISPTGPDVEVVGYAVDGRPEPKVDESRSPRFRELVDDSAAQLGLGENRREYDDYAADDDTDHTGTELQNWLNATGSLLRRASKEIRRGARAAGDKLNDAAHKLRYSDRQPDKDLEP